MQLSSTERLFMFLSWQSKQGYLLVLKAVLKLVFYWIRFVVFSKRHLEDEARLRVFCMTDDKEDKTLEHQEHFLEVAKSKDVEVRPAVNQSFA